MPGMERRNSVRLLTLMVLCLCAAFMSCQQRSDMLAQYKDITTPGGWYEKDTILLHLDTIPLSGTYSCNLCVRTNNLYPYENFSVIAQVTVYDKEERMRAAKMRAKEKKSEAEVEGRKLLRREVHYDIVPSGSSIFNSKTSTGVAYHDYEASLGQFSLTQGDSVVVAVKQNMRRETIPSISSVGAILKPHPGPPHGGGRGD